GLRAQRAAVEGGGRVCLGRRRGGLTRAHQSPPFRQCRRARHGFDLGESPPACPPREHNVSLLFWQCSQLLTNLRKLLGALASTPRVPSPIPGRARLPGKALGLGWQLGVTIARRPDTVDLAGAGKFGDASPIIDLEARSELCQKLAVGSPGTQREAPCAQMWTPSSSGPGLSALRSRAP